MGMISANEAARRLQVSARRVGQLAATGVLAAQKVAGVWMLDEDDVARRASSVKSRGGRPVRGSGATETRYMLMNRTHELLPLVYDDRYHAFTWVGEALDVARLPLCLAGSRGRDLHLLNSWWRDKGIPGARSELEGLLSDAGVHVPDELIMRNLGLSLSDQYWVRPDGADLAWGNVNFFTNDFSDADALNKTGIEGKTARSPLPRGAHPDNTSDGNLKKHWVIERGERRLLKSGSALNQEPFNEVVATLLHGDQLEPGTYVAYRLEDIQGTCWSSCPLFLTDEEEYIPAIYVLDHVPPHIGSDYNRYLAGCAALGCADAEAQLWRMMVCDDILANSDRHFRNFGVVRNVETLEVRPAPIFDTGTSLWCDAPLEQLRRRDFTYRSKQFYESPSKQMLLVDDFGWLEPTRLASFPDRAAEILARNPLLDERVEMVRAGIRWRIDRMLRIAEFD